MNKVLKISAALGLLVVACAKNPFTGKNTMALVPNSQIFPSSFQYFARMSAYRFAPNIDPQWTVFRDIRYCMIAPSAYRRPLTALSGASNRRSLAGPAGTGSRLVRRGSCGAGRPGDGQRRLPPARPQGGAIDSPGGFGEACAMGVRDLPTRRQPKLAFLDNQLVFGGERMPAPDAITCD